MKTKPKIFGLGALTPPFHPTGRGEEKEQRTRVPKGAQRNQEPTKKKKKKKKKTGGEKKKQQKKKKLKKKKRKEREPRLKIEKKNNQGVGVYRLLRHAVVQLRDQI